MNIIITGAANGIGAALANKLISNGHRLLLISRNKSALNQFKRIHTDIIARDLQELIKEPQALFEVLNCWGHVDTLVNNAGLLIHKPFEKISLKESRDIFEINYFVPEELIRLTLPYLKESSNPSILNISSMGGVQGSVKFPGLSAYSASKAAIAALSECLAEEFKEDGIIVNALALGAVQTEMLEKAFPNYQASCSPDEMADYIRWFVEDGYKRFNGKILPVSDSTP